MDHAGKQVKRFPRNMACSSQWCGRSQRLAHWCQEDTELLDLLNKARVMRLQVLHQVQQSPVPVGHLILHPSALSLLMALQRMLQADTELHVLRLFEGCRTACVLYASIKSQQGYLTRKQFCGGGTTIKAICRARHKKDPLQRALKKYL